MISRIVLAGILCASMLAACNKTPEAPEPITEQAAEPVTEPTNASDPTATVPETENQGIPLEGMFRYMADAPLFRDCHTGKTFPVAMAGPYIELERAYLNSGIEPGAEIKVSLYGRYLEHPSMEGNNSEIMLIVDSFDSIIDSSDCIPDVDAALVNTYWKLIEVNGKRIDADAADPDMQREPHMVLAMEDSRVRGFAGCNNFFGKYELDDNGLSFSALGSTMMACPQGMDTEQAFLSALGETSKATVSGLFLDLYSGDTVIARFEAVYLP